MIFFLKKHFELNYACFTDAGTCRANNQDSFFCLGTFPECDAAPMQQVLCGQTEPGSSRLFGVFDGMGGEYNGEIASFLAAKRAASFEVCSENPADDLLMLCRNANSDICQYAAENGIPSMGTTAAMLLFEKDRIYLCNIGDSKIFRCSKDGLEQISEDHLGIAAFGRKPPLSQNLGIPEDEMMIEPYTTSGFYNPGDKYLICSDGLTDLVSSAKIRSILRAHPPQAAASALIEEALSNGGKDNVTVIVIEICRSRGFRKK